ncbi:hypothetical protein PAMP_024545 [Pampus punctatissimus]
MERKRRRAGVELVQREESDAKGWFAEYSTSVSSSQTSYFVIWSYRKGSSRPEYQPVPPKDKAGFLFWILATPADGV